MKVAILFWGLTRSLEFTHNSIKDNVFRPLDDAGISFDVFMHTYSISGEYVNLRTRETLKTYSHEDYKLISPRFLKIDNQEKVINSIDLKSYRTHPDPWKSNYQTVDFFILAMYSKKQVTQMMVETGNVYERVLFLRPDVLYLNKFNPTWLTEPTFENKCLLPNIYNVTFEYRYFVDRMACCNYKHSIKYGMIFDSLLEYSKIYPLHSETLHAIYCICNGIRCDFIPFYFNRVRSNGAISNDTVVKFS